MLDLNELRQLVAFADLGTLSKVAEEGHISTPSITRSMKNLEDRFGVPLFTRSKNRIALNETGQVAVEAARKLLAEAEQAVQQVRDFDQRRRTLVVKSCAPAPLWELMPKLSAAYPGMTIASHICPNEKVLSVWAAGDCDIAILPFPLEDGSAVVQELMHEKFFVCVPPTHELAQHKALTFAEINGFNFLLRTELGFWDTLCRQKMPASRFLVQTDEFSFDELVASSSLPCFTTDYFKNAQVRYSGRAFLPLADPEADVTFYLAVRASVQQKNSIGKRQIDENGRNP